jgi:hypothetical protein
MQLRASLSKFMFMEMRAKFDVVGACTTVFVFYMLINSLNGCNLNDVISQARPICLNVKAEIANLRLTFSFILIRGTVLSEIKKSNRVTRDKINK